MNNQLSDSWQDGNVSLFLGDSLNYYAQWNAPIVIISDGAYGILGFEGDTSDHLNLPSWYEPHIRAWSERATPQTTLWFWNSEIGWASVHPVLERYGWRYVNANIWNKGKGHIAGNVNTKSIRRFPVVTEICVQYAFETRLDSLPLKAWLLKEWKRTGLPLRLANAACGVKNAATRKYLDQGHLWYPPPPQIFEALSDFANKHGEPSGRPYFACSGSRLTHNEWASMRYKFRCPLGHTNVWDRGPLRGIERITTSNGRAAHPNQKPLDLMRLNIEPSSDYGDVVWEPFGGLFSAAFAAKQIRRKAFSCEKNPMYYRIGISRFTDSRQEILSNVGGNLFD